MAENITRKRSKQLSPVGMGATSDITDVAIQGRINEVQENIYALKSALDAIVIPDPAPETDLSDLQAQIDTEKKKLADLEFWHQRLTSYVYALDLSGAHENAEIVGLQKDHLECRFYNIKTEALGNDVNVAKPQGLRVTPFDGASKLLPGPITHVYDYGHAFVSIPNHQRVVNVTRGSGIYFRVESLEPDYFIGDILEIGKAQGVLTDIDWVDLNFMGRTWKWDGIYRALTKAALDLIAAGRFTGEIGEAVNTGLLYRWTGTVWTLIDTAAALSDAVPEDGAGTGVAGSSDEASRSDHVHKIVWLADGD